MNCIKQWQMEDYNRKTTNWLSGRMKRVLNQEHNLAKPHWSGESYDELISKLLEKVSVLQEALSYEKPEKREVIKACIDVANYTMMIADNANKGKSL